MGDRAERAGRREAQLENQANMVVDIGRGGDGGDQNLGHRMGRLWKKWLGCLMGGLDHLGLFRRRQWIPACGAKYG